jgi:hypothetical protein
LILGVRVNIWVSGAFLAGGIVAIVLLARGPRPVDAPTGDPEPDPTDPEDAGDVGDRDLPGEPSSSVSPHGPEVGP